MSPDDRIKMQIEAGCELTDIGDDDPLVDTPTEQKWVLEPVGDGTQRIIPRPIPEEPRPD
jgi:hypothetical protein